MSGFEFLAWVFAGLLILSVLLGAAFFAWFIPMYRRDLAEMDRKAAARKAKEPKTGPLRLPTGMEKEIMNRLRERAREVQEK